jgi:hypothetical protein
MKLKSTAVADLPEEFIGDSEKTRVRLSLDISQELNQLLERLSSEADSSKSDILRKGIVLMEVFVTARKQGKKFGVAERDQALVTEIVGL